MHLDAFATRFDALYRALYQRAVHRLADGREKLAPETAVLLQHLAQSGPLTLGEAAAHLKRAPSTLSAKFSQLEAQGLLARQSDTEDGRRSFVWLTPLGRARLQESQQVLDTAQLGAAARRLSDAERAELLQHLQRLLDALPHPEEPAP